MKTKHGSLGATIFALLSVVLLTSCSTEEARGVSNGPESTGTRKVYEHTNPEAVVRNDYFQGEFVSNDVVAIYPRREALVRDVLVDIGDTVTQGQTLALLFEPGVQGQSASNIGLKSTMVQAKSSLLEDAKNVRDAKVAELDAKILELEILIVETEKNYDAKIAQIGDTSSPEGTPIGNELEIEMRNLEILESQLKQAQNSRASRIADSENNISQKSDLFETTVGEIFAQMLALVYLGSNETIDYDEIDDNDIHITVGARNSSARNELVQEIRSYQNRQSTMDAYEQSDAIMKIIPQLITVLENTVTSVSISESELTAAIASANSYGTQIITQKEVFDDALHQHDILLSNEDEKIINIEYQIAKQNNVIALLHSKLEVTTTDKSLAIEKLKSQLATLKKSKDLLIANENKSITSIQNELSIARADLNKESVVSGDYRIVSPFSGTISKRDIQIGEMASMSMEAFRVAGVENSLSKITKKEIKFYVPEGRKDDLAQGTVVTFFSSEQPSEKMSATIYRVSPEIDMVTRSITVQAKVDDTIQIPNMSSVRVTLETEQSLYQVPTSSIYNKGERKIMYYKKDNGKLGVKDITIVSDDGEFSLVQGDFDETLKVVTTPIFIK